MLRFVYVGDNSIVLFGLVRLVVVCIVFLSVVWFMSGMLVLVSVLWIVGVLWLISIIVWY